MAAEVLAKIEKGHRTGNLARGIKLRQRPRFAIIMISLIVKGGIQWLSYL